jgi:hypothetical protein
MTVKKDGRAAIKQPGPQGHSQDLRVRSPLFPQTLSWRLSYSPATPTAQLFCDGSHHMPGGRGQIPSCKSTRMRAKFASYATKRDFLAKNAGLFIERKIAFQLDVFQHGMPGGREYCGRRKESELIAHMLQDHRHRRFGRRSEIL